MRWWVFAVGAYLVLALQVGAAPMMAKHVGSEAVEPRFPLLLALLVGLFARATAVGVAWGVLGVLTDLIATHNDGLVLVGPYALGYLAGAYLLLQVRQVVLREHALTFGFLILVCGAAAHLVLVGVLEARYWLHVAVAGAATRATAGSAAMELATRMLSLSYTAFLGLVLSPLLFRLIGLFGLSTRTIDRG